MISLSRLFCAFMLSLIAAAPAMAQQAMPLATGEEVAIAFFKAGDARPDFEKWAKGTRDYQIVAPTRAADYVDKEKQRFMRAWRDFNLDSDVLNIRSTITVHLKHGASETGEDAYAMEMAFEKQDAPYFPFKFQDYRFAVIPQKIDAILKQPLTKAQFDLIYADFEGNLSAPVTMFLQMKPVKSYLQQPYEIDGEEQWVLLADPVTLSLKSRKTGADLWTYGASWYVSPAKQEVRDLYVLPDKSAPVPQSPQ